jgi:hypothetical protein
MFIRTERREYRSSSWLMKRAELAACGWYAVPAAAARRSRQAGSWPSTQVYDIDREPDVRVDGIREGWPARVGRGIRLPRRERGQDGFRHLDRPLPCRHRVAARVRPGRDQVRALLPPELDLTPEPAAEGQASGGVGLEQDQAEVVVLSGGAQRPGVRQPGRATTFQLLQVAGVLLDHLGQRVSGRLPVAVRYGHPEAHRLVPPDHEIRDTAAVQRLPHHVEVAPLGGDRGKPLAHVGIEHNPVHAVVAAREQVCVPSAELININHASTVTGSGNHQPQLPRRATGSGRSPRTGVVTYRTAGGEGVSPRVTY